MKKKWLGFGLALLIGTSVVVSDVGMFNVLATGTSNTTSTTSGTTGGSTGTTGTENQTSSVANNAKFTVDGEELVVTENLNPNKYPEDFTETQVECKGKKYKGLKFDHADIQMICLLNQKTGAAAYHIYRDSDQSVYPFIKIESGNDYIIAMPSFLMEDTQAPSGYTLGELEFEKGKAEVYQTQEGGDSCLIYAMDSQGNKNWYEYNSKDKTYQVYQEAEDEESGETVDSETQAQEDTGTTTAASQYQELETEFKKAKAKYRLIIAVMVLVIAALAILLFNTLLKNRRDQDTDEEEPEDEFDGDEGDFYDEYEEEDLEEGLEETPEEVEETVQKKIFSKRLKSESKRNESEIREPEIRETKMKETEKKEPEAAIIEETVEKKEKAYDDDIEILDLNDL